MTSTTSATQQRERQQTRPGADRLRIASIILAIIGTGVALYLAWAKLTNAEIACIEGFSNCDLVNESIYAYIAGVPVAYLGLLGYLGILGALVFENRLPFLVKRGKLIVFGLTLFGFLFSAYLTAIEAFVLHEWCQWCVISAITMTLLFGISFVRLWRAIQHVPEDEEAL
jgi:uncharacterized membrane protein